MKTAGKYDYIDFKPPKGVADQAAKGLRMREEYGRGGTQIGVARARDLKNRKTLSPETVRRMYSYFSRHEVDKKGKGWKPGGEGYPSAGRIAWLLWGGDAGFAWARKVRNQMEAADKKKKASTYPTYKPQRSDLCYNLRQRTGKFYPESTACTEPAILKDSSGNVFKVDHVTTVDPRTIASWTGEGGWLIYTTKSGKVGGVFGSEPELHQWCCDARWFSIGPQHQRVKRDPECQEFIDRQYASAQRTAMTRDDAKKAIGINFVQLVTSDEPYAASSLPPFLLGSIMATPDEDGYTTIDLVGYKHNEEDPWTVELLGATDVHVKNLQSLGQNPKVAARVTHLKKIALWPFAKGLPERFEVPQNCLCDTFGLACTGTQKVTFERGKGGKWIVNGKLSPMTDQEAGLLLKKCEVTTASTHTARRPTNLDQYRKLKKKDVKQLKVPEFNKVTNSVVAHLLALEEELKAFKKVLKLLQDARLNEVLAKYEDVVVEFEDVVMGLGAQEDPRVNYKALLASLVDADPKLATMIEELKEAQLATAKPPKRKVLRHLKKKEPKQWQELEHKRMKGRVGQGIRTKAPQIDTENLISLLEDHVDELDLLLAKVERAAAKKDVLELAADTKRSAKQVRVPERVLRKVLKACIKTLRNLDWGQPPEGQLPKLEKCSSILTQVGIKPVDVDLAISSWTAGRAEEAQRFIDGPSGRGTNLGAVKDLQHLLTNLEKAKTAAKLPSPAQIAQKILSLDSFKNAVRDATTKENLADALLVSIEALAGEFGEELLSDEKYVQAVLKETIKQLEKS